MAHDDAFDGFEFLDHLRRGLGDLFEHLCDWIWRPEPQVMSWVAAGRWPGPSAWARAYNHPDRFALLGVGPAQVGLHRIGEYRRAEGKFEVGVIIAALAASLAA